ncbi:MFS transporter [Izhakiella australiensis]|uniref:MFS transporter n=1 Tax=Izhakiella australiensis TaxID=1926881 RepID=A0A1S8YMI4_9GAMM|nr:MFS transporter [Izhakiella australiensis]OON40351.1 MFS transporter [Izhakiella australiensis]
MISHRPPTRAIILLGLVQIIAWGGSFYLLAVLAQPVIKETGWSQAWVYGSLSLALLISGLLAPLSGRIIARGGGRRLLAGSGITIALGLIIIALSHALWLFLLAWVIIGIGMAMGLYDALFAVLGTLYGTFARGAITGITLISGFCTSLVWPGLAALIAVFGWRDTCLIWAGMLIICVWPMYMFALPGDAGQGLVTRRQVNRGNPALAPQLFWLLCAIFTLASVIMTAISVQLIALLQSSGYALTTALALSAILGPCQVASRMVDMVFRRSHPIWTTFFSVGLVALGLLLLTLAPQLAMLSMILYGAGNGLRAIVRGTLPLAMVSTQDYAIVMGRMARPALIGQALTPLATASVYATFGAGTTLWLLVALGSLNLLLVGALKWMLPLFSDGRAERATK